MSPNSELHADIRAALQECLVWMEAVNAALETFLARAADRNAKIDLGALGKLVGQASQAMRDLDTLIDKLLSGDASVDVASLQARCAALESINQKLTEAVTWYADDLNWRLPRDKAKQSPAMADKGTIAQQALDEIEGRHEDGEGPNV